jgi:hypothetical protein
MGEAQEQGASQTMSRRAVIAVVVAAGFLLAVKPGAAAVNVRADFDKTFDFAKARTWGWSVGVGDVIAGRFPGDDPEGVRKRAEPVIMDEVNAQLPGRGLRAATGEADLTLRYYLLLTVGDSMQQMGQFVPAVVDWGLPLFPPATTSYKVIQKGSLVFDFSAKDKVVWRGVAEASIKMDYDPASREKQLREAVRELLKKYPPKQ